MLAHPAGPAVDVLRAFPDLAARGLDVDRPRSHPLHRARLRVRAGVAREEVVRDARRVRGRHALLDAVERLETERQRPVEIDRDVPYRAVEDLFVRRDRRADDGVDALDAALQTRDRGDLRQKLFVLAALRVRHRQRRGGRRRDRRGRGRRRGRLEHLHADARGRPSPRDDRHSPSRDAPTSARRVAARRGRAGRVEAPARLQTTPRASCLARHRRASQV